MFSRSPHQSVAYSFPLGILTEVNLASLDLDECKTVQKDQWPSQLSTNSDIDDSRR